MIDKISGAILPPVIVRDKEDRHTLNVKIDVEDFYIILNSMTDSCGCLQCRELVQKLKVALSESNRNEVSA
jgi:hypothetical protein